jgi:antitoxin MazE
MEDKNMETTVKKWGNSLGIRIPNAIARELSLKDGSFVEIKDKGQEIIISLKEKSKLSEILNKINEKNVHSEVETNGPVGNEIW